MPGRKGLSFEERFWMKVCKNGPVPTHVYFETCCWQWTAGLRGGYGSFRLPNSGPLEGAHRVAWKLTKGPIPTGMHVLHACDNQLCCNPSHLFLGDNDANVADKMLKGRQAFGAKSRRKIRPVEGRNGMAKLTVGQVNEIRSRVDERGMDLALEFGVTAANISAIRKRHTWTHI